MGHADLDRPASVEQRGLARLVALRPGQSAGVGPTAVAVHGDGHVLREDLGRDGLDAGGADVRAVGAVAARVEATQRVGVRHAVVDAVVGELELGVENRGIGGDLSYASADDVVEADEPARDQQVRDAERVEARAARGRGGRDGAAMLLSSPNAPVRSWSADGSAATADLDSDAVTLTSRESRAPTLTLEGEEGHERAARGEVVPDRVVARVPDPDRLGLTEAARSARSRTTGSRCPGSWSRDRSSRRPGRPPRHPSPTGAGRSRGSSRTRRRPCYDRRLDLERRPARVLRSTRAAVPAVIGAAIEVPENVVVQPLPLSDDSRLTPGRRRRA